MKKDKMIIYSVLPRLFGNRKFRRSPGGSKKINGCGKFNDFTTEVLEHYRDMGITHMWYIGVIEHATRTDYSNYGIRRDHPAVVKGEAGSPYAIKDYYDVDPDLAVDIDKRMEEFEQLIARTHEAGLKVIIDFVPNHLSREYHSDAAPEGIKDFGEDDNRHIAFSPDNNYYYIPGEELRGNFDFHAGWDEPYMENPARATGNDKFDSRVSITDWYETVKLNYGVDYAGGHVPHFDPLPDTWLKMRDILLYWAGKGVDGFRCDMAEMVPVEFWHWVIPQVKEVSPSIVFIAEIYNPGLYREYIYNGGFDYLYDKVGLYDTLRAVTCGTESASVITQRWQSLDGLQSRMLNFMENHDEQRLASDFFAGSGEKGKPAMIISATMNTNPAMIYFGQEIGERGMDVEGFSGKDGRTTIFDYWTIRSVKRYYNEGHIGQELLTDKERLLLNFYTRLLNICNEEKAISQGEFFDLTYANLGGWAYNEHRQYAYLRYYEGELILVAVNFDDYPVNVSINIPRHAFEYLGVKPSEIVMAEDLLTGTVERLSLTYHHPVSLRLEGKGGKILKLRW